MSKDSPLSKFFKAIINVFKEEKKPKKPVKKISKKKKTKKQEKKPKKPSLGPKKSAPSNVQMPAPWSKVEKFKRIKKDNYW